MVVFIISFLAGIPCILLGRSIMRGNLSLIQAYHQSRVSEADKGAFGKQVGLGTILTGIGILVFGVLSAITVYTGMDVFLLAGTVLLAFFLLAGLMVIFHAMGKYNKGIF